MRNKFTRPKIKRDIEQSSENDATAERGRDERPRGTERDRANDASAEGERPAERTLPLNQTFEILKNQRRRYVLRYLDAADGPVSLSDLAEQMAAWENEKEIRQITSSERKRVYVGLYQCHLPKMDGMDIVSFNKPRGVIERSANADCFDPYLRSESSSEAESRYHYQAGLAVLSIGLLPISVLLLTDGTVPLVVTILLVCALALGTAFRLSRDEPAEQANS